MRSKLTGIRNMSIPLKATCRRAAVTERVSDHSNQGIRKTGSPNKNIRSRNDHLTNSDMDVASSSINPAQSYKRHASRNMYAAKAIKR